MLERCISAKPQAPCTFRTLAHFPQAPQVTHTSKHPSFTLILTHLTHNQRINTHLTHIHSINTQINNITQIKHKWVTSDSPHPQQLQFDFITLYSTPQPTTAYFVGVQHYTKCLYCCVCVLVLTGNSPLCPPGTYIACLFYRMLTVQVMWSWSE